MARHDESDLTLLNDRNIHALHQALKIERERVDTALQKAENAIKTVTMLQQEIIGLRAQLAAILQARM